jgi:phosphoserine phosphatase RsbU/P
MDSASEVRLHDQLIDRRRRLEATIEEVGQAADLVRLLQEVDSALKRLDHGAYGTCVVCKESVETDFLLANPLIQYCLCSLSEQQQRALQNDLELASRIQLALLPRQNVTFAGWEAHFRYEPAGAVSGDYVDIVTRGENGGGSLYFLLGDVSGKGVAASFHMARLNALFRTLIGTDLAVAQLVEKANRHFSEGMIPSHYASLVCGRAVDSGRVEICNAGHCPPLIIHGGDVSSVDSTGFPVGLFAGGLYEVREIALERGDTLFLFTDGLTEACDGEGEEYGLERLGQVLRRDWGRSLPSLVAASLKDHTTFTGEIPRHDDLTVMAIRRTV